MSATRLSGGTIPALDGVRALAVSLVFLAHAGLDKIIPGGLGVTVFFVLSGYLITTLMRIEFDRNGRLDLPRFYQRRALRLLPPLAILITTAAALSWLGLIDGSFSLGGLLSTLLHLGNYYIIGHDFDGLPAGVGVIWSLAVEEHFYLLYPPLAGWLLRRQRPRAIAVLTLLTGMVLVWRLWLHAQGTAQAYLGMATDTRADAILIGCIAALWRNPWLQPTPVQRRYDAIVATLCIATLLISLLLRSDDFRFGPRYTLQALAIAPLLQIVIARAAQPGWRWLDSAPLRYLGTVSYSIYLFHHLILFAVLKHWPLAPRLATLLAATALTLLVAEAMRRWVEAPCARRRRRLHATIEDNDATSIAAAQVLRG